MKKFHLIFFLTIAIPLFIAAQANLLPKQSQPAIPRNGKTTVKIATPHTSVSQAYSKERSNRNSKGRTTSSRRRRKRVTASTIYGNEWINYSQKYFKIRVGRNGIYRMDSLTLAKSGIPVNSIKDSDYQLFFRGQQQYIYIKSKTTYLSEKNGDYIEFYGQYNDGIPDSTIYYNTNFLPNPYYSLFTDTSTYYLTWSSLSPGLRMKEVPDTSFAYFGAAAPYIIASSINLEHTRYFAGAWINDGTFTPNDPRFTQNAAWTYIWIGNNSQQIVTTEAFNPYTGPGAPAAFLRTVVLGTDNGNCTFNVSTVNNSLNLWNNVPCSGFAAFDLDTTFPANNIGSGFGIKFYNNNSTNGSIIAPTYIYLNYPHTLDLGADSAFMMSVSDNTSGDSTYLDFTDFSTNTFADSVRMVDLTNHKRFWVKAEGGGFKVIVPNSGGLKQCYLFSDSVVNKVTGLIPVGSNANGTFTNYFYEPGNTFIIITHSSLLSDATAYAAYRGSVAGGSYHPVIADVQELYDQFGYGVCYSPLGIRRFCNFAIDRWDSIPSYLFFIGKGINTPVIRPDTARWSRAQLLVPSYGYPSSDILFTNGLGGDTLLEPAIPTGRIAAANGDEVKTYLTKVQTYESTPPALWMKKIAHFAGGDTYDQEQPFLNYLNEYADIISDTVFGGNVYTFQKTSPAAISGTLTDSIVALIDTGVSIMTFFGHASGTNWDESIDFPSDYSNYGKYPFIIANACFSGDIFEPIGEAISSVSEQFVLESPGSIGFLASDYLGDPGTLQPYTQKLYEDISWRPFYGKSIGKIVKNTIDSMQQLGNQFMPFTILEMTLHCDPAIAINAKDTLPDYAVNNQSIYFTPSTVNVLMDSFKVNLIVSNYAEALYQPVKGELTRTFPDGTQIPYTFTFNHIFYQDTVSITIPVNDSTVRSGEGLNYFTVRVNIDPKIDNEFTYTNNSISNPGVLLWISSEDITPVWPYDYAIIPKDTVTLKASTNDPFAPQRTYIFEIDTSHKFNSHLFRSDTVTQSGGVVQVTPYDWIFPSDTIHYNGQLKSKAPVSIGKISAKEAGNKVPVAGMEKKISGKTETPQNNFTISKPAIGKQSSVSGSVPAAVKQVSPVTPSKGFIEQKNNLFSAKTHYAHAPYRDSFINGAVYYWRVRRDTADLKDYPWVTSSFQYIKNRNGWGQSDFFQYYNDEVFNDDYNFVNFNTVPRDWTFNSNGRTLACFTYGMIDIYQNGLYETGYELDNFVQSYAGCQVYKGIYVAVIDSLTLIPWSTNQYDFGSANDSISARMNGCSYPDAKFDFWDNNSVQTNNLIRMLSAVPRGDYILAYSWVEGEFKMPALTNDSLVVAAFQNLGATQMPYHRTTPGLDSVPWIFFVQKGHPTSAIQIYGRNSSDTNGIKLFTVLKGNGTYGAITTPLIGPSAKYDSLSWYQHPYDRPPLADSTRLNVIGVKPSGNTTTLMSDITPAAANLYLSSINPVLFPYIRLVLYTKDLINHTPAQMNYWRVFYQPVPEVAMNPNIYTYYHKDSLQYGDTLRFQTVVQNISDWPIDSTRLLTWTTTSTNNINYISSRYASNVVKRLNPGDTAKISMWLPDANSNANTLKSVWFEVNPENYPDTRLEQYHFNDYASKSFYSYGDKINPVLDVTFNGIHILNNDIVSPQPNILISVMDENKFLALNNPNDFQIFIRNINNPSPTQVSIGTTLSFTPAVLPHNRCSFLYTPNLADGTYELTVQGTDISGNLSANNSYKIDFEVINKSMISEVLNYPNPFSTSTRFVFILTGEEIPTIFKIQIMTVTGKIVREINEDEIGPVHIGRNITQYAWDGTDKYGDKLANGVYLYRVVTSINGENIDDYKTPADQYFTKGWGKMYLMR